MVLGMPLPTWKQLLSANKSRKEKSYYEKIMDQPLFFSESCMSINMVLNAVKKVCDKEKVSLFIPDFFCSQTISSFGEEWLDISFYPITKDFNPDWDFIKAWIKENPVDIMIFTHYFGVFNEEISRTKEFCFHNNIILIEDCAHILYPTGKIGTYGDFIIFSPHKQLPIPDGAVLLCNESELKPTVSEINKWIRKKYSSLAKTRGSCGWFIKKTIQKVVPIHRSISYYHGVHYGSNNGVKHEPKRISNYGYNLLCDYQYIDLKKIAFIRRRNLELLNYYFLKEFPDVISLMNRDIVVPYFAVYSLERVSDKEQLTNYILKKGFPLLFWPDLPIELKKEEGHSQAKKISEDIIILPIHQNLKTQKIVKKLFIRKNNQPLL